MKRREFTCAAAAAALSLGAAPAVRAQGGFVEGKDFVKLATPAPTSAPGKVEVVEFFWYGCPHCFAFEPQLDAWSKKVPDYVAFRRVPVGFTAMHETHARLFYTLEAMQQVETLHRKVFNAMHQQRRRLDKEADIVAFATENSLDGAKFTEAFKSFGVATKVRQAKALTDAYKIDGVPSLGVQGRYFTSGALAGSNERALAATEYLINLARKSG
ncbi:thiol:disulfide interchange protein DsbA/DsbL [Azohydromonas aeria]|uniref:thiol:disulfide interchange protein DsbA/DsbL n=1 Tax=Azohydromonas aeria TaxID=2590212 RepID=UPI0012FCC437|nr:thiol:disulfide interchange protein DsbA/DsbL [Azohydromonas aeria]